MKLFAVWFSAFFNALQAIPATADELPFNAGMPCEAGASANVRAAHLNRLNAVRLRNELETVGPNLTLDAVAQAYACLLAETGHFDHIGPDGTTPADRAAVGGYHFCYLAENLATGYPTVGSALIGWVRSQGHWENLVTPHAVEVGLGVAPLAGPLNGEDEPLEPNGPRSLTELFATMGVGGAHLDVPAERFPPHATRYVWVQLFGAPCF